MKLNCRFLLSFGLIACSYLYSIEIQNIFEFKTDSFVTNDGGGQLGNQLYRISAAVSLAIDNKCRYYLPKHIRDIYKPVLWRLPFLEKMPPAIPYRIEEDSYDKTCNYVQIKYQPNSCLQGYFLSHKYFDHHKDIILKLFAPSEEIKHYIHSKYAQLMQSSKSVGLHIRTFYKDVEPLYKEKKIKKMKEFYRALPSPDLTYIQKAIESFPEDSIFVVCSDNMNWAKKALNNIKAQFVFIEDEEYFIDFYLLSMCKSIILSNSSFSWWAAYLNESENKKVIAPVPYAYDDKRILEDTYPEDWMLIPRENEYQTPCFDEKSSKIYLD